jgi:hypothetical protein
LLTPAVGPKVTANAADGQNPLKPRVYPTAECRIGPMGQVTTSKGGVRVLHGSTAVKIHSWLAMFASFGRTLAPGNGRRGGFAPLTSDDSESIFAGLGQRALIGQMHEGLD